MPLHVCAAPSPLVLWSPHRLAHDITSHLLSCISQLPRGYAAANNSCRQPQSQYGIRTAAPVGAPTPPSPQQANRGQTRDTAGKKRWHATGWVWVRQGRAPGTAPIAHCCGQVQGRSWPPTTLACSADTCKLRPRSIIHTSAVTATTPPAGVECAATLSCAAHPPATTCPCEAPIAGRRCSQCNGAATDPSNRPQQARGAKCWPQDCCLASLTRCWCCCSKHANGADGQQQTHTWAQLCATRHASRGHLHAQPSCSTQWGAIQVGGCTQRRGHATPLLHHSSC